METERELLALAAKAAGKKRHEWDFWWLAEQRQNVARDMLWDPRRDSGQALELAVKLHILVSPYAGVDHAGAEAPAHDEVCERYADHGGDELAATRMAIFHAAVEIGRSMP